MTRVDLTEQRGRRLASMLQGALNDLKRDGPTAARELGVTPATLDAALDGSWPAAAAVRERMLQQWPISERDLAALVDDTDDGVRICPASAAKASSRTLMRGGDAYYEYRDVAMSELSPIRPEWIQMLAQTSSLDPEDTGLRWNNGHALHQLTYFRGPVDFYVEVEGQRLGYAMNEGDSAFIPSFLPHTFATRTADAEPYILAVTFHGRIHGDVREELSLMDVEGLDRALGSGTGFAARLHRVLGDASMPLEGLAQSSGLASDRLTDLLEGSSPQTRDEVSAIAAALGLRPIDLEDELRPTARPVVLMKGQAPARPYGFGLGSSYLSRPLARSDLAPKAWGVVLTAPREAGPSTLEVSLHQFGYVLGPNPVRLTWTYTGKSQGTVLGVGDSFYMQPWIKHGLAGLGGPSEVLSFRAPHAIGPEALHELARCERRAQTGFVGSQQTWYRP